MINPYHYSKNRNAYTFFTPDRQASPTIGFELEVDRRSRNAEMNEAMANELETIVGTNFFFFENDCSVNNGFEIISQPSNIDYLMDKRYTIESALEALREQGYLSHDGGKCGLHVHIDREYFSNSRFDMTEIEKRFLKIFIRFSDELSKFSRRNASAINDWATLDRPEDLDDLDGALDEHRFSRYYAVNITNRNTIELRLWRGTLISRSFFSTLKLSARIAEVVKDENYDIDTMNWYDLLGDDEELNEYWDVVKERRV